MLVSMTGYGDARVETPTGTLAFEIRSVNNRHLKVTVRGSDPYPMLESEIEKVVRRHVKRGTIYVQARAERTRTIGGTMLNGELLRNYIEQIQLATQSLSDGDRQAVLSSALTLPGVAPENASIAVDEEWPLAEKAIEAALKSLNTARNNEGAAMAAELRQAAIVIRTELASITDQLPRVMVSYRTRLLERMRQAVQDAGVAIEPEHIVREAALFADRCDVHEEITRLHGHLAAFEQVLATGGDGPGRRLEFMVQEMGREANTLGSKAGDVTISRHTVEIKATLEKIRELVQNVE
jgi:uncharacterized protein (TIGR00255 family)